MTPFLNHWTPGNGRASGVTGRESIASTAVLRLYTADLTKGRRGFTCQGCAKIISTFIRARRVKAMKQKLLSIVLILSMLLLSFASLGAAPNKNIAINVALSYDINDELLADIGTHGRVKVVMPEIRALTMQVRVSELAVIRALPYVAAASPDAERHAAPIDAVAVEDFMGGINNWEHDQNSHGTHVTSTILGYNLRGTPVNGVAPMATIIPVKVLNQNGSGWSSVIAQAITYVTDLHIGELAGSPMVINMSLGGATLDAIEKAA